MNHCWYDPHQERLATEMAARNGWGLWVIRRNGRAHKLYIGPEEPQTRIEGGDEVVLKCRYDAVNQRGLRDEYNDLISYLTGRSVPFGLDLSDEYLANMERNNPQDHAKLMRYYEVESRLAEDQG